MGATWWVEGELSWLKCEVRVGHKVEVFSTHLEIFILALEKDDTCGFRFGNHQLTGWHLAPPEEKEKALWSNPGERSHL